MFAYYAQNCFWLLIPILLMNLLLMGKLPRMYQPEAFSKEIPRWIVWGENALRTVIFVLPLFMPLRIVRTGQMTGFAIYLAGAVVYFLSWGMQIWFPLSAWSRSRLGFMAPGFTPLLWLIGLALVGDSFYFSLPHSSWIFAGLSTAFLIFHNLHSWIVYSRNSEFQP